MTSDFSLAAQTAAAHSAQWKNGWQYGTVWKLVNVGDDPGELGPPAGSGWEPNVDRADHGVEWVQPAWAKGDRENVRQYRTYWRRRKPGIVPGMSPDAHVHVQIQ